MMIACCAVVVAMVAGLVVFRTLTRPEAPRTEHEFEGRAEVTATFAQAEQHGLTLGDPRAPVSVVEYVDVKCPKCGDAARDVIPSLVSGYVRPRRVSLTLRPLAFLGPDSRQGALAMVAAGRQGHAWQLAELMLRNQGPEDIQWVTPRFLTLAARAAEIDPAVLRRDMERPDVAAALLEAQRHAEIDEARSTPFWVVRGPRGTRTLAGADLDLLITAITEVGPPPA